MRYRAGILSVVGLCLLHLLALPNSSYGQPPMIFGPVTGVVSDPAGKPAAGAHVCVLGRQGIRDTVVLQEVSADAQGRFRFEQRSVEMTPTPVYPMGLTAEDSRGRIGGSTGLPLSSVPAPREVPIQLRDVQEYRGRLVDASGKAIVGAHVKPQYWHDGNNRGMSQQSFALSPRMIQRLTGKTGEDGTFVLRGLPKSGSTTCVITTKGFGSPYANFPLDKPLTIALAREGRLAGAVVPEGGNADLKGVKLFVRSLSDQATKDGYRLNYYSEVPLDAQGKFHKEGIPAGKYALNVQPAEDSPVVSKESDPIFEVKPDQEANVSVTVRRALAIRGKVIEQKTGKPVPGVQVYFYSSDNQRGQWGKAATTNDQGIYTVYVKPGELRVRLIRAPDGYAQPRFDREPDPVKVTGDMTWADIQLEPTAVIEGIVVDEAGKPVSGCELRPFVQEDFTYNPILSDANGKFVIKKGKANQPLPIRVRNKTAVSDGPVMVVAAELKEPVRIVISEKKAFTVRGRLVDAGKPVASAPVHLKTMWLHGGGGIGFQLESASTDSEGRFEFRALWAGDQYQVLIEATGFEKYETSQVTATAGKMHDFGEIALSSARGTVEGTVVDSAGKPLSAVTVFNAGDAPKTVVASSDAQGKFRLEGLRAGSVWVFARQPGYRFTGIRTESGKSDVQLKLLRTDEPVPARPKSDYPSPEEQKQIARGILERLWKEQDHGRLAFAARAMVRIDPERAVAWSREVGGKFDSALRPALAKVAAETDLDEALAMLAQDGDRSYRSLRQLAEELRDSDKAKALRLAEEAALTARKMDQPGRTVCLAEIGKMIFSLGNEEAGRKLIDEAAEMAAATQGGESRQQVRPAVAQALAMYDPDRALKLLEPVADRNYRMPSLMKIAASAAPRNLAKTEEILKTLEPWYRQRIVTRIACELGPSRPDDALRLVNEHGAQPGYGDPATAKVEALGWIAVGVAPRDPKRAWNLIDQALDATVGPRSEERDFNNNEAKAALLAVQAKQAGYPDMESVAWRVLASRQTTSQGRSRMWTVECHVSMALLLALAEPEIARDLLKPLEPFSGALGSGGTGISRREWAMAWVLADPRHAAERVQRELAENKDNRNRQDMPYQVNMMLELLAMPPGERLKYLGQYSHWLWMPGRDW